VPVDIACEGRPADEITPGSVHALAAAVPPAADWPFGGTTPAPPEFCAKGVGGGAAAAGAPPVLTGGAAVGASGIAWSEFPAVIEPMGGTGTSGAAGVIIPEARDGAGGGVLDGAGSIWGSDTVVRGGGPLLGAGMVMLRRGGIPAVGADVGPVSANF
jgi:hypothetical protein